jgi:hypothetical protein
MAAGTALGVLALLALAAPACRPVVRSPGMDASGCAQEIRDTFGEQRSAVLAIRPVDGGPLFRAPILEAVDRVCQAFEGAMTDDAVHTKCLTNVPLMESRPDRVVVLTGHGLMPISEGNVARFHTLVMQFEFAPKDIVDPAGSATYIHLPAPSYEGVDLAAIAAAQARAEAGLLAIALDQGRPEEREAYAAVAGGGAPSADYFVGLYDTGTEGGLKEPEPLLALERFQGAAEALPRVAQTFTFADDLKVVRRGLHKGNPGDAVIPPTRREVAQLLVSMGLSGAATAFGPRLDSQERIALIRVNLQAGPPEQKERLGWRLDQLLQQQVLPGHRAFICLE